MARVDYRTYIESDEWKFKAKAMRWVAGNRCQVCNSSDKRLDTHHRTYDNLGKETPQDLTVLCEDCHRLYHRSGEQTKVKQVQNAIQGIEKYLTTFKSSGIFVPNEISADMHDQQVNIAGIISSIQVHRFSTDRVMYAEVHIEDIQAKMGIFLQSNIYDAYKDLLIEENLVLIHGKVFYTSRNNHLTVVADCISNEITSYRSS